MSILFNSVNGGGSTSSASLLRYALASNLNDKVITFQKFGSNPQIASGSTEDIWDVSGDYTYATTATIGTLVSTSALDNPSGTGVGSVTVQGLDENWNLVSESVTLNGTTPVNTVNLYIRVFRIRVLSVGVSATLNSGAVGDISITVDSNISAQISQGNTTTNMTMLSVPEGYTGFINSLASSGGPNDDFIIHFQARFFEGNQFVTTANFEVSNSNTVNFEFDPSGGNIPEKSDMKFRAEAVSNNTQVRVLYTVVFVKNTYLQELALSL